MLQVASSQPDFFCREAYDSTGQYGEFCTRCHRKIIIGAVPLDADEWCIGCGFETGVLPMIEVPLFWSAHCDAFTFEEAQILKQPDFCPLADLDSRLEAE